MTRRELDARLRAASRDFWVPSKVSRVPFPPKPVEFVRDFVGTNTPVIFTGVPTPVWSDDELVQKASQTKISVNRSPCGLGDHCLVQKDGSEWFVKPQCRPQCMASFLNELECTHLESNETASKTNYPVHGVPYYSAQSDCLRTEIPGLLDDLPDMSFAEVAFGNKPDAINLWIGDSRSTTAMHKVRNQSVQHETKASSTKHPCT